MRVTKRDHKVVVRTEQGKKKLKEKKRKEKRE